MGSLLGFDTEAVVRLGKTGRHVVDDRRGDAQGVGLTHRVERLDVDAAGEA
ncbi:hypothetical protein RBH20_18180 [Haloarcula sp. H-GB4]|uniref:hypothetical protein n=1 Tax=Haloarcula sp. H-GB4 TaxID=3069755 RepID=UPI0027B0DA49|nr:hypothetical protein [Haloarcula sp. H-GB4]MDQ2074463.1 hypothetical protein [Haloarcula sp. H-GB4]